MPDIKDHFHTADWVVLFGYLFVCTVVGHLMKGKQSTIRDFFLGGRSLPWPAVSGSIIATEISGVTFIGVPGMLFAMNGNFTYLQWAIGSIIARFFVARFFVRVYYEQEIYSPYDYMGARLGVGAKKLATILFTIGSILAQSVRVLVAAIALEVVTPFPQWVCIIIIGLFAVGWTLMGGMRTVIWTDVMQFVLFTVGGAVALFWIIGGLAGGWGEFWGTAEQFGRTKLWDLTLSPTAEWTLWVALIAVPFQNLTAFGVDQLNAQRMFCCRDAKAAGKAIIFSSVGQLLTLLMLMVGTALFVHYHAKGGFNPAEASLLFPSEQVVGATAADSQAASVAKMEAAPFVASPETGELSNVHHPEKDGYVFPMWIVTTLPAGLAGLILAGVFAAAISSLDSILAALSQTTLSLFYHPEKNGHIGREGELVARSRLLVIFWGILLTGFTLLLIYLQRKIQIVPLAFGLTAYTVGPLLALFLAALWGKCSVRGLVIGSIISIIAVTFVRTDFWQLVLKIGTETSFQENLRAMLVSLPTYEFVNPDNPAAGIRSTFGSPWMWPITTLLTLAFGFLIPRTSKADE